MTDLKFVILSDIHIGPELIEVANGWELRSAHDTKLLKRVFRFIDDFEPNIVILAGDQFNFDDISDYNKRYKIDKVPGSIKKAFESFKHLVAEPLRNVEQVWWMDGNHEARLNKFVAEFPALDGLLRFDELFVDRELGVDLKHFSRGQIARLGKLHVVHGDTIKGGGKHPASALMGKYHCNIRCGHFHRYTIATENSLADATQIKTAVTLPCLRNRQPGFLHNSPNAHIQGFDFGFITKKGNFNDYVVVDTGGFTVDGKHYS